MSRKFNNPRYATRGISAEVPLVTQLILWGLVDSMKVEEQDCKPSIWAHHPKQLYFDIKSVTF